MQPQRWYVEALSVLAWIVGSVLGVALIGSTGAGLQQATSSLPDWLSESVAMAAELAIVVLCVLLARGRLRPPVSAPGFILGLGLLNMWAGLWAGFAGLMLAMRTGYSEGIPEGVVLWGVLKGLRVGGPFLFGALGLFYLRRESSTSRLTSRGRWAVLAVAGFVVLVTVGVVWFGARTGLQFVGPRCESYVSAGHRIELERGCGTVSVPAGWQAEIDQARAYPTWALLPKDSGSQGQIIRLSPIKSGKTGPATLLVSVDPEPSYWKMMTHTGRDETSTPVLLPRGLFGGSESVPASSSVVQFPSGAMLRVVVPNARPRMLVVFTVLSPRSGSLGPERVLQLLAPFELQLKAH